MNIIRNKIVVIAVAFSGVGALAGCATTSGVMPNADGSYTISGFAAPIRGGATGANAVAFQEAQDFCEKRGGHARLVAGSDRDIYQSSFSGGWNQQGGGFGGGSMAAGSAKIRFICTP